MSEARSGIRAIGLVSSATTQTITEDGPEISGWNIDYSLRIDFFF